MLLDVEVKQDTLIVRPRGEIDLGVADQLRMALEEALDREASRNIIFNLGAVSFIDSSGLGVLLGRFKRVSRGGGRVFIVAPQPQVHRILDLSGLLGIMALLPSEAEALKKIG